MQFEQAGKFIVDRLYKELPAHFTYHSLGHTLDVRQAAERLGKLENITPYEMQLLLTAALFHDTGFLIRSHGHEEESCRIAQQALPGFEYTTGEIEQVCGMIRATHIPQLPQGLLQNIMADADLDYLGRDDFFEIGHRFFEELSLAGAVFDECSWNKLQLDFMESHHYFTKSAINLRQAKKEANMAQIKAQLIKQTH